MNRRSFVKAGVAAALGSLYSVSPARAQFRGEIPAGASRLELSDDFRDGTVYVPKSYKQGVPMPLAMMLHGYSGSAESSRGMFPLAEELGCIILAPESRDVTWGRSIPGFDADVRYLGAAFRHVSGILTIDSSRVALGGQSDGAGYALSMGLAYGDVFNHLLIFAGGMMTALRKQGKPRIFFGHGVNDEQMPIDRTARRFAAELQADGYDVTLREHPGGHGTPSAIVREGFEWFLKPAKPA